MNILSGYTIYPIVTTDNNSIPVGSIVYKQVGVWGSPIGLLLGLTITPQYIKCLKTLSNGLVKVQ